MTFFTTKNAVCAITALAIGGITPTEAAGQAQIELKKGANTLATVELEPSSTVEFLANGNLQAQCRDADNNSQCDSLPSGGGTNPNAPTISTFTRSASTVTAGTAFTLAWNSPTAEVCQASATPVNAAWSGPKSKSGSGVSVVYPSALTTPAQLQLICYNAAGASQPSTVSVEVTTGTVVPPPSGSCPRQDPLIQPVNYLQSAETWQTIFSANFPPNASAVRPLTLSTTAYAALPVTLAAGGFWSLFTLQATQGQPAGGMFVTISDCAGDFRAAPSNDAPANDPTLKTTCRSFVGAESGWDWATTGSGANPAFSCVLPPGQYYLNIIMASGSAAITNGTNNTCLGSPSCTIQFNVR